MNNPDHQSSAGEHEYQSQSEPSGDREEILESLLDETRQAMGDQSAHAMLTDYVREHRLASTYDFDNLTELVRCVLARTRIDQLPIDKEETITWIASCFYEDPVANERVEALWKSIVQRIQEST